MTKRLDDGFTSNNGLQRRERQPSTVRDRRLTLRARDRVMPGLLPQRHEHGVVAFLDATGPGRVPLCSRGSNGVIAQPCGTGVDAQPDGCGAERTRGSPASMSMRDSMGATSTIALIIIVDVWVR